MTQAHRISYEMYAPTRGRDQYYLERVSNKDGFSTVWGISASTNANQRFLILWLWRQPLTSVVRHATFVGNLVVFDDVCRKKCWRSQSPLL
ncbi:hypothetical protein [Microseira sp. BLCC-F43]|uniref:hypothetical protein n=1 Tax=Microseira sp. BLCC-F43 TaxID=3153602 RepID=UPI0035BAD3CE